MASEQKCGNDLKRRTIAFNSMSPELRNESFHFLNTAAQARLEEVRNWHRIGEEATALWWYHENENSQKSVSDFAKHLGYKLLELQQAMDFYGWLPEPGQLEALLKRRGQGGLAITWGHIKSLLKFHDVSQRNAVLELIFENGMTARDVAQEFARHNRRSRVMPVPRGTQASLNQIDSMAIRFSEVIEQRFTSSVYEPFMTASGKGLDQRVVKRVSQSRSNAIQLAHLLLDMVVPGLADVEEHLTSLSLPEAQRRRGEPWPD